jgi:hypothetical protein
MVLRIAFLFIVVLAVPYANAGEPEKSSQAGSADATSSPRLEICLHNNHGSYGYTYEELLKRSSSVESTPCVAVISERDILEYRVGDKPAGRVELQLSAQASSRITRKREGMYQDVCEEGLFTVALDGKPLYRGQCYTKIGAAALNYPVMHIESGNDGTKVLRIGSHQGAWIGMEARDSALAARIDPPELRELFKRLDKLGTIANKK